MSTQTTKIDIFSFIFYCYLQNDPFEKKNSLIRNKNAFNQFLMKKKLIQMCWIRGFLSEKKAVSRKRNNRKKLEIGNGFYWIFFNCSFYVLTFSALEARVRSCFFVFHESRNIFNLRLAAVDDSAVVTVINHHSW